MINKLKKIMCSLMVAQFFFKYNFYFYILIMNIADLAIFNFFKTIKLMFSQYLDPLE